MRTRLSVVLLGTAAIVSADILVIRAGRVLDVENRAVLADQAVVIEDERILSVERFTPDAVPEGANVIDLTDATLLPGLIDTHNHLLHEAEIGRGTGEMNLILEAATMSPAARALRGTRFAREMLFAGITTVRDLGNSGNGGDVALRDAIAAGWVIGPRMVVSTRALSLAGGQFGRVTEEARPLLAREYAEVSGAEEARRAVREALYAGADCIKVIVGVRDRHFSLEELKAIVGEARRGERGGYPRRPVAAHAVDDRSARLAAEAGVDSIEHGYSLSRKTLELMAQNNVSLVPTDAARHDPISEVVARKLGLSEVELQERHERSLRRQHERLRMANELGVRIVFGSDAYTRRPGLTRGEASKLALIAYREAGLEPWDVVVSATASAALLVGLPHQIGYIDRGYYADLLAVDGNPLEDIHALERVRMVFKSGVAVYAQALPGRP